DHALTGKLTDNDAGGAAIGSATIVPGGDDTFGAGPFTTAADGSYSATGTAPPGPAGPHSDTAKYLGDGSYNPAGPITANYNTLKHNVTLTLAPIANLMWSFASTCTPSVTGTLTDNDAGAAGIPAAIIAISGSGLGT